MLSRPLIIAITIPSIISSFILIQTVITITSFVLTLLARIQDVVFLLLAMAVR